MRKRVLIFATLILVQVFLPGLLEQPGFSQTRAPWRADSTTLAAEIPTPAEGELFPDLTLPLPQNAEEQKYLGVEEGPFRLSQLKAEGLIIEIFSMYCPHCQREAPNVNKLFRALSNRPDLKSRLKLIGIGASNSGFEVNTFRTIYRIEFPLIPDGDLAIHRQVGGVGTPYFFVLRNNPGGKRAEVLYSRVGTIGDPAEFLDMIAAKLDKK